jgi:copper(I)-binding protein
MAALSLSAAAGEGPQVSQVSLVDAWVRALPPIQETTAAYLTLHNRGQTAIEVVGASADVARQVQIHTTRQIEGYTRMERLRSLTVAPGESAIMAPGGTHLMLLGLSHMPVPGESVRLCLQLAGAAEVCTAAGVRKAASAASDYQHHHR